MKTIFFIQLILLKKIKSLREKERISFKKLRKRKKSHLLSIKRHVKMSLIKKKEGYY